MQKFDTPAAITAIVNVPAGRIHLIAADRADTTVEVLPANDSKSRDVKAAQNTTVEYVDGVLRIQAPAANTLGPSGALEVTVKLPAGSRVEAKSAATELRTIGRLGDVTFEGAYRTIKVDEVATLRLTATDGDVEVGRLYGPAEISTAHGDIRVAEAAAGQVTLSTQSGDISIGAAAGVSASLDASTSNGRISNALKNDGTTGLDIRATTSNGDITARSL